MGIKGKRPGVKTNGSLTWRKDLEREISYTTSNSISGKAMQTSQIRPSTPFNLRAPLRAKLTALPAEHGAWVFLLSPLAVGLAAGGWKPASTVLIAGLLAAFAVQPLKALWGALHPAVGVRPKAIGFRQLAVSVLFTLAFIAAWVKS